MITGFLLIIFAILLFLEGFLMKKRDLFNPLRIYSIIWIGLFGLYLLHLSDVQKNSSLKSWVYILLSYFAFVFGYLSVYFFIYSNKTELISKKIEISNFAKYFRFQRMIKIILAIFIFSLMCFLIELFFVGSVPLFSENAEMARLKIGLPFFHLFVNFLLWIIPFLTILYFVLFKDLITKKKKIILFFIIFICFLLSIFTAHRSYLLTALFFSSPLIYYIFLHKKRIIALILLLVFVLMIGVFWVSIEKVRYPNMDLYKISKMNIPESLSFLTTPYMYTTQNLENLHYLINTDDGYRTYGLLTLQPLFAFSLLNRFIRSNIQIRPLPLVHPLFNQFTYLFTFYLDFGLIGILVFPYIIGTIAAFVYYKMKEDSYKSIYYFIIFCWFNAGLLFSFYFNFFFTVNFIFTLVFSLLIFKYSFNY